MKTHQATLGYSGYIGLQRVTWDYTGLQMATQHMELHRVTESCKGHGYMRLIRDKYIGLHIDIVTGLQQATYMGYMELHRVTCT